MWAIFAHQHTRGSSSSPSRERRLTGAPHLLIFARDIFRTGRRDRMDRRLTTGSVARLVDAIEHLPEAVVVWDPDDTLVTCNRQYARLFPEPSFVRPGIRFAQLVELNIDTSNVRSFASVADVPATPQVYRRVRRQAHSTGAGVNGLEMADGRRLQVSER